MHRAIVRDQTPRTETRDETQIQLTVDRVQAAVGQMQYGQIVIHVRDGVVTQIERSERTRLFQAESPAAAMT